MTNGVWRQRNLSCGQVEQVQEYVETLDRGADFVFLLPSVDLDVSVRLPVSWASDPN